MVEAIKKYLKKREAEIEAKDLTIRDIYKIGQLKLIKDTLEFIEVLGF